MKLTMRQLSFRPFRRVGDKLVVTGYTSWYKLYTANYEGAIIKLLPFPEIVKGEIIYSKHDPNGKYKYWYPTKFEPLFWYKEEYEYLEDFDANNCPAFSHKTAIYISENYPKKMHLFEPLTADIVYKYFEIMRDTLTNLKWTK